MKQNRFAYITADRIGEESGGGAVTYHESTALKQLDPEAVILGRDSIHPPEVDKHNPKYFEDPWMWDNRVLNMFLEPTFAHFYAGTFSNTIRCFKKYQRATVSYTAAAHCLEESKREHTNYGMPYGCPHMVDPNKWKQYLEGYLLADLLICPSTYSKNVMKGFGREEPIEVIPHGCEVPETTRPIPTKFAVGYLGSCTAPDKGLIYLLQAWKKLNLPDAVLYLGGKDSTHPFLKQMIYAYGGGQIRLLSWVKCVSSFYNLISLYVQPSVTEGFGIEIIEAMAHERAVIASKGAGASEIVDQANPGRTFEIRNVEQLCSLIIAYYKDGELLREDAKRNRKHAENFTWEKVRQQYVRAWEKLLGGGSG